MKKISVVLPTLNECQNLEKTIGLVLEQEKYLPGWQINVVVADDVRTTDGSEEFVGKLAKGDKRIHYLKTDPGIGVALIEGHNFALKNIHPNILAQMDADGQVDAEVIRDFVKIINEGYDLVIGSRFVEGGKNLLSPSRRFFTWGSSIFSRVAMGPMNIKEFSNSARAFTPTLFNKINLDSIPWREKTFIIQPAFLNAAIIAGAKYKEVPLVFKDRAEGYSKMQTFNYIYDVVSYAIEARLRQWGMNVPVFYLSRRAKTFVKFGMVGFVGTLIDFIFYKIFINVFGFPPATAKGFSTEIAIVNNFFMNNFWTFRHRKTTTNIWQRMGIFNLVSLGGLILGVLIVKFLHMIYGDGFIYIGSRHIAYNNFYFFATIPPVMIWNFVVNHFITWKHTED